MQLLTFIETSIFTKAIKELFDDELNIARFKMSC